MKKTLLSLAAIGAVTLGQTARAADGTINFNGLIENTTCTIDVNGTVTPAAATVTLPTVSIGKLAVAGKTDGQTGFIVGLKNCMGPASTASAFFEPGPTVDVASGNLNTATGAGTANNVQLQLMDASNGAAIKAGDAGQSATTTKVALDASGNANLPYAVRYYATDATTAGSVNSSITYAIEYL